MSVVLSLAGAPRGIWVIASPLAELTAALHAYTEAERHPGMIRWARSLETDVTNTVHSGEPVASLTPALRRRIRQWAPLWASYRARYLFPFNANADRTLAEECSAIADLPLPLFAEFTAYAVRGGNTVGPPLDQLLDNRSQRESLLSDAELRSTARSELARRLLDHPEELRADLLDLLAEVAQAIQPDLARAARAIAAEVPSRKDAIQRQGPGAALADLDHSATYRQNPPRVVFDKFHYGIVNAATTPVIVLPSIFGRPHLLVKHEMGHAAVIQYPLLPEGEEPPGYAMVHRRLEALRDPGRQRIARAISREPLTPSDLAYRSGMTLPQVSRHLARLREVGLVTVERDGRRAYYHLDLDKMRRLGDDLLAAILH